MAPITWENLPSEMQVSIIIHLDVQTRRRFYLCSRDSYGLRILANKVIAQELELDGDLFSAKFEDECTVYYAPCENNLVDDENAIVEVKGKPTWIQSESLSCIFESVTKMTHGLIKMSVLQLKVRKGFDHSFCWLTSNFRLLPESVIISQYEDCFLGALTNFPNATDINLHVRGDVVPLAGNETWLSKITLFGYHNSEEMFQNKMTDSILQKLSNAVVVYLKNSDVTINGFQQWLEGWLKRVERMDAKFEMFPKRGNSINIEIVRSLLNAVIADVQDLPGGRWVINILKENVVRGKISLSTEFLLFEEYDEDTDSCMFLSCHDEEESDEEEEREAGVLEEEKETTIRMPKINVKWQKEKFSIDVDLAQPPLLFKTQLFTLSQVLPERQKVLITGKQLPDDSWDGFRISDNMTIMMMGTTGDIPTAPAANTSTRRDSEDSLLPNESGNQYPVGMVNLGNTCYFNSCVQLLKEINELNLTEVDQKKINSDREKLGTAIAELIRRLRDKDYNEKHFGNPIQAIAAVLHLSNEFPQFEKFKQQDANECFVALLNTLTRSYKTAGHDVTPIFNVETVTTAKCLESDGEEEKKKDIHNQLTCYINQDVRFIQTGIKAGFSEEMERNSEKLGRNAKWQKNTEICRLPKYLTVNMNRFFFKESSRTTAKILKSVQFPLSLDVYDMCTPELKESLTTRRADIKLEEDAKLERELRTKVLDKDQAAKIFDDGVALPSEFENDPGHRPNPWYPTYDPGSNNSGFYDLRGIISHKGRSSNGGHYVAWVKSVDDGKWRLFDDDHVTIVDEEAILKTSGGGDWHSAYVLVYESKVIKKYPELAPAPTTAEVAASEPMEISNQ